MRFVSVVLLSALLLTSCQEVVPDFTLTARSSDKGQLATLRGFQPRGTIEGYLVLSFNEGDQAGGTATFRQIENGQIGWIATDTLAVVADRLNFNALASDYFPDGTVKSRVRLIVCARQDMDCSSLAERLNRSSGVHHIAQFPEG